MHFLNNMSDTEEIYDYQLVEFVKRGPKSKVQDIECVPSSWISFNVKKGKAETKFMPPPYEEATNKLLYSLIKAKNPPLHSWPNYTIVLKGHASKYTVNKFSFLIIFYKKKFFSETYEEVEKRLEKLRTQSYAFTTDSEILREVRVARITNQFKTKKIHVSLETQKALQIIPIEKKSDKSRMEVDAENYNNAETNHDIDTSDSEYDFSKPGSSKRNKSKRFSTKRQKSQHLDERSSIENYSEGIYYKILFNFIIYKPHLY